MFYLFKIIITTVLVLLISEFSKRNNLAGAILASLPVISIFALLWLYIETHDLSLITKLSKSIFWLVLPSLVFFLSFPLLLKCELNFYVSICLAAALTVGAYVLMIYVLSTFGIRL